MGKIKLVILALSLSACAGMPPDKPIFVEISPSEGFGVHMMSGKTIKVDETHKYEGKTWWEMRPEMIYMPASTWAPLKAWINKICKTSPKQCDKAVANWERTIKYIDTQLDSKKLP